MKDTVRVLTGDDHPHFREGMRGRLDLVGDIAVVGEAASDEAVARVLKVPAEGSGFRPDWREVGSEVFVRREEAQIGKWVRIRNDHRTVELAGTGMDHREPMEKPGIPCLRRLDRRGLP